jgi:uncharacterized membrane protein
MTGYSWLVFVHILAAITWVGGAILLNVLNTRSIRADDPARLATAAKETEWVGTRIIAPTTVVLLAMGITMVAVNEAWTIGQLWIILALVLFGLTFATGAFFLGPEAGRIARLVDERGVSDPEVRRRLRRVVLVGRVDLITLIVVVWDMVVKPGL